MEKYRQNIFGIGEVYELQREGQWVEKNRESYREFGYFGGGYSFRCLVQRIDYSNDTTVASLRGSFTIQPRYVTATGNSNFGYFGGGNQGGGNELSTIQRIDYSNDGSAPITRSSLSAATRYAASTGNNNFGYFSGGSNPFISTAFSKTERVNYSNDLTNPSIRGPLSIARTFLTATGNSNFGYFGGGSIPGVSSVSTVDRLSYSNDTNVLLSRTQLLGRLVNKRATGNNNFGYFGGGYSPGVDSRIYRIDYANDTAAVSQRSLLSIARHCAAAAGNSNFGYFGGGATSVPTPQVSTVDRIDYSNDTATVSVRGPLSVITTTHAATSSASFGGSPVSYLGAPWVATAPFGYFGGGSNPGVPATYSTIDRVDYTNDTTTASSRGLLSSAKNGIAAAGNSNFGYFSGSTFTTVDRIDYSNDSAAASVRGPLTSARYRYSATGNTNFGYHGGGRLLPGPLVSTINRIQYSNDTADALPRGTLTLAKFDVRAVGNSNFGYFCSGNDLSISYSTIERIDYSNDNVTAATRGVLIRVNANTYAATGNSNFGYLSGGITFSTVERIDYSNDTATASVRGPLSLARWGLSATGSQNFGYFGSGFVPVPSGSRVSTVDRVDYSNDTQVASARGPLSSAKGYMAASSSQAYGGAPNTTTDPIPTYIRANTVWNDSNTLDVPYKRALGSFGYFGGGFPGPSSRVDRIDYSSDTATAPVRGPLAAVSYDTVAAGNSNFGYYTGRLGRFNRIDYSNDLAAASYRGSIPYQETMIRTAVGNNNFGYFRQTFGTFQLNRLDYSNDSASTTSRFILSRSVQDAATGNSNFGYFGAGAFVTNVDRMSYANDTANILRRGDLTIARNTLAATGNYNFGYFGGGQFCCPTILYSRVDRIDYSNDTATASIRGPLSSTRQQAAATGNSNFGYFGGGQPTLTSVDRIDYSNDTATASVRGPLSLGRRYLAATTNARSS